MIQWSLAGEFMAFIVIATLMLYFNEKRIVISAREKLYSLCLRLSLLSIGLNVLCIILLEYPGYSPYWLNMIFNSGYFILIIGVSSLMVFYLLQMILEHVYDKSYMRRALTVLISLNVLFAVSILWNIKSGILFYFDSTGVYHRGNLNLLGYGIVAIEIIMVYYFYWKNLPSVSRSIAHVLLTTPPLIILLCIFQVIYREIIVNETALAVANLVIFISFQNSALKRDFLTQAGNRESFFENMSLRLAGRQKFQIILLALRQFDVVNQSYGYQKGDKILCTIVNELGKLIPDSEVYRFGNVEFALILPWYSEERAEENLNVLRKRCQESWMLGDISTHIRTVFMHLEHIEQSYTPSEVMTYLEYGIRKAKEAQGHNVRFNEAMLKKYEEEKRILELIQHSIEQNRFEVWYQPVYHLKTGCWSAEALLRLKDYDGNPVPPSKFIPVAEASGLIDDLSWIVLEETCAFLSEEGHRNIQSISVNLSMQQFADMRLSEKVQNCLNRHNITPDRLKIEVTERVILHDMGYMKKVMNQMTEVGIGFYLDDFGTGYSNLVSVLEFPFECVKLDKSLLKGFPGNSDSEVMVRTLVELFHGMGDRVVVEGVEEEAQAKLLDKMGVDCIQGYYYSRPLPRHTFSTEYGKLIEY
ncbi:MAG: EAL domain-containing protein [Muricomes sp.]